MAINRATEPGLDQYFSLKKLFEFEFDGI